MQGAGFDVQKESLVDAEDNAPEYLALPTAYLAWVDSNEDDPYPSAYTIVII